MDKRDLAMGLRMRQLEETARAGSSASGTESFASTLMRYSDDEIIAHCSACRICHGIPIPTLLVTAYESAECVDNFLAAVEDLNAECPCRRTGVRRCTECGRKIDEHRDSDPGTRPLCDACDPAAISRTMLNRFLAGEPTLPFSNSRSRRKRRRSGRA